MSGLQVSLVWYSLTITRLHVFGLFNSFLPVITRVDAIWSNSPVVGNVILVLEGSIV